MIEGSRPCNWRRRGIKNPARPAGACPPTRKPGRRGVRAHACEPSRRDRRGRPARRAAERAGRPSNRDESRIHPAGDRGGAAARRGHELRQPEESAADGGRRGGSEGVASSRRRCLLRRTRAEPEGLRASRCRGLQRDRDGSDGQRYLQPPQPGRVHGRVHCRMARDRRRSARGRHPSPGHGVGRLRLPVRGRGPHCAGGGDRAQALPRRVRTRSRWPTRSEWASLRR